MKRTTYQVPELRDENDNIIQEGTFGKHSAFSNSTNDGAFDYILNDLEALHDNINGGTGGEINTETITGKTGTITNLTATTVKTGTVTADAMNGPLTGDVTGNLNGNVTGDVTGNLTGNVTGTADKAVADGNGNNIANTYVTKSGLASSVTTTTGKVTTLTATDSTLTNVTITGTTSVPTANAGNSSKAIANTEFVAKSISALVNGAPDQLNTLNELAKALGNDSNFAATVTAELAKKLNSTEAESTYATKTEAGVPLGFEAFTTNPNLQAGWLPLLGGEYSRTTYADLWAWVQTQSGYLLEESAWQAKAAANGGNVPFYSKGDGSTTFRVPALKCWMRGANSINEVGGYLAAGLPNITGGFGLRPVDGGQNVTWETNNGAIKATTKTGDSSSCVTKSSSYGPLMNVTIDASRSNSIYGKSTTVQPESIVGMWVVKAYGTVTNVGSTDVANISTGLTQAETRISTAETRISAAVPTGVVQAFAGNTLPNGWLLCDGSAVSRTDYAALYAVIGTTYGAGDGSTTFNLPNLVDKFVEGSATAGTVKSAGLPNIKGQWGLGAWGSGDVFSGASTYNNNIKVKTAYLDDATAAIISFDASKSNSIYGSSNTVQPPALTMRYIIKY